MRKPIRKSLRDYWFLYLPYLYLHIGVPLITISISIMYREAYGTEWFTLYVKLFKWKFEFSLFDPKNRQAQRRDYGE